VAASPSTDDDVRRLRLEEGVDRFRAVRRQLEASVLPLATSLDGRRFTFQASLHGLAMRLGGYVVVERESGARLGQVLELQRAQADGAHLDLAGEDAAALGMHTGVPIRMATGAGALLDVDDQPFHDAAIRPAATDEVRRWMRSAGGRNAVLDVGELALARGVTCEVDAGGFDRHTFLCGQSGSGKTYALGVVLERLLLETQLRIVVLDPNSDFVRLGSVRDGVGAPAAARYGDAARAIAVHSMGADRRERLRLRLAELQPEAQAALLRLDPIDDRQEHAELLDLLQHGESVAALLSSPRPAVRSLALRARSLGLDRFGLWAGADPGSTLDAVRDPSARCVVVDLGSLAAREERSLAAAAVLGDLWRRRNDRNPVLIVVDEAHNVCPGRPEDALTALATAHAVRIAAEGRKFGLYLLVATQRPQKVHENVISQCDNLILMRLNSAADAAFAQSIFSFVPPRLVEQAAAFRLGEALIAGKISRHPALARFGARLSQEGGADVPATWATASPE
jgi:DNA helicase HerA-like ATPase